MSSLDIVKLIENHPISKLTSTYNVKLLDKIKIAFTEAEQQLFIGSFYCYLQYDTKKDFVVDLDNVWKWMGFSQKVRAKEVIERHFIKDTDYKEIAFSDEKAKVGDEKELANNIRQKRNGGHNIKKIMMTIKCFKSLCLKAQTKKASEIHEYYLKMEEILHEIIEEEGTELKQMMERQKQILDQKEEELRVVPELEKHKILLREFGIIDGSLVYIVKVATREDGYVIKIGESRKGIKGRWNEFRQRYGEHVVILDCFLVNKSADFERFLHSHHLIRPSKVTNLPGHEKENELFLIGQHLSYATLIDIIEKNIRTYNYSVAEYDKLKTEYDKLKLEYEALRERPSEVKENEILKEILETNRTLLQRVSDIERSQGALSEKVNASQTKTTTKFNETDSHVGPRLQKINPNNLQQIIKVYETVTECIHEDPRIKRPSVNKAVRENTVYCGFRWQLVDRSLDPSTIYHIQPTKGTKIQHLGYIAQLDNDKTQIIRVYLDRKSAAYANEYKSSSALDNAVKSNSVKNGFYYQLFDDCDPHLRDEFLAIHGTFLLYKQGIGKFNKENILIEEFICKDDCVKKIKISQKSLAKVLDKPLTYDGFYFRNIGHKLSI